MSLPRVRLELERRGILLVTDPELPSVTRIVAGEPVRGSWWSHPKAHAIYAVLDALEDDPAALLVKLVRKKLTFVHRSLWPELFAVATATEPWQTKGLSAPGRSLLASVDQEGNLRVARSQAKPARELEEKLLAHGCQEHTETGAHAKVLETWQACADKKKYRHQSGDAARARAAFEQRLREWPGAPLPWQGR